MPDNEDQEAIKSGARNAAADKARIKRIRDAAQDIHATTLELDPDDTDFMKPVKGEQVPVAEQVPVIYAAVKAVGDWELEVLGVPFGGPNKGKDSDGEYFSGKTNLELERFASPLVTYYHGLDPDGKPQGDPEIIGKVKSFEKRADGIWWRVALDKTSQYARRVWEAAKQGAARASSGSIAHLVRKAKDGEILHWPVVELTLLDAAGKRQPANQFAVALPVAQKTYQLAGATLPTFTTEDIDMEPDQVQKLIADALKADREAQAAEAKAKADRQAEIDAAVKADREQQAQEAAKANRLPNQAPAVTHLAETGAYDDLDAGQHAFMIDVYEGLHARRGGPQLSDNAIKSLAMKLGSEETLRTTGGRDAMKALKATYPEQATKSYEINYSTYSSYGSQWVATLYQTDLWQKIRAGTWVLRELEAKGDVRQIPDGYSSDTVPLETTDPTWYKVAEAAAYDSTSGYPVATVTSSLLGTSNKNVTLAKMGCRVIYTGEMVEDSLVAWVPNAYRQIQVSGQEIMEHALIDGDTSSANVTNINHIGAQPTGNEAYTLCNGFRKLALVTDTTNSRDGGALDATDFLETLKLMGTAGLNGADPTKVTFIVDAPTYWKLLEMEEVLTRDVFSRPTIENGVLTSIWGYPLQRSYFMHYAGVIAATVTTAAYQLKANSDGKVDQTTQANNTKGAILAVRWDQWALRWKRRMTIEVDRFPASDSSQITALLRWGLGYRDVEASAISYNLTV